MFENFEACTTWNCFNSFALWISAVGTVTVSSLALWLSIKDKYVRMSNRFSLGLLANTTPDGKSTPVFILEFTNIGARPVTVTNYKWKIPFNNRKVGWVVTFPQLDKRVAAYCTKLPSELTDGKSGNLFLTEDFFSGMDNPQNFMYPKNRFLAFIRIFFFRVFIGTTIGKNIPVKIDRSLRKKLWNEYREQNT